MGLHGGVTRISDRCVGKVMYDREMGLGSVISRPDGSIASRDVAALSEDNTRLALCEIRRSVFLHNYTFTVSYFSVKTFLQPSWSITPAAVPGSYVSL